MSVEPTIDPQLERDFLLRDLLDCLEYREGGAHVQVIVGKGAVFWETLYHLKRGPMMSLDGGEDIPL